MLSNDSEYREKNGHCDTMKIKTNFRRGMTLMEVIISILLAGLVLTGLATALTWSLSTIRASRESAAALQAAQQEIEQMRNSPFDAVDTHTFPVPELDVEGSVVVETGGEYTDMKKVSVKITWVSGSQRNMHVNLATYITKDGIGRR
jgi:prepilin-type N-terminal cleavage/methylation domain-containing protein